MSSPNHQLSLLLQLSERSQHIAAVPRGIDAGINPGNLPARIDEESMPRGKLYHSKIRKRSVGAAHLTVAISQQLEVQSFFGAELFMRVHAVHTYAENHGVPFGVLRMICLKVVRFPRASRSLILGVRESIDLAPAVILQVSQKHLPARAR